MPTQLFAYFEAANNVQHEVMFLEREGNILSVNQRFARVLGYPKEQFVPKTIFQVSPYFNFMAWKKTMERVAGRRTIIHRDRAPDGKRGTLAAKLKVKVVLLKAKWKQYIAFFDREINKKEQ